MEIEDSHRYIHGHQHLRLRHSFFDFEKKFPKIEELFTSLYEKVNENPFLSKADFQQAKIQLEGKYQYARIKNTILIYLTKKFYTEKKIEEQLYQQLINFLQTKSCRSNSGILEVAPMTSPWNMAGSNNGCDNDCYFCPNQKGFPRSYIKEEPGPRRAAQFNFDCVRQIHDRVSSYMCNGHEIDKLEIIILGGTWSSYEYEYQKKFMTEVYYAANTFYKQGSVLREKNTLLEEQQENETSLCKIIGLTIETRPDSISREEIRRFNEFGVTRVQVGIQTTHDHLLKKINRGCYNKDTILALRLLKESGFKILIHVMPNLPGSNPDLDIKCFKDIMFKPEFQADEIKIYPTSVTTTSEKDDTEVYTVIEKWYRDGKYVPYSNEQLYEVIKYAKREIPNHFRISRIFRDIPIANITGGANIPNMRQELQREMCEEGHFCKCIRCREIKDTKFKLADVYYQITSYDANEGVEYFISANIPPPNPSQPYKNTLVGFLRLRFSEHTYEHFNSTLQNATLVRELHVYGKMKPSHQNTKQQNTKQNEGSQHRGIGKKLLRMAEDLTSDYNIPKIAVISGVGVRKYYEKQGYNLENGYMVKVLPCRIQKYNHLILLFAILYLVIYTMLF